MKAEIWTKTVCPYCVKAKKILDSLNISYEEHIISAGVGEHKPASNQRFVTRDQLLERCPTARTVPQIWIDGTYVGGCDQLEASVKNGIISSHK